jgi:hypothetical protein
MQPRIPLFLAVVSLLLVGIACGSPSQPFAPAESTPQPVEKHLSAFRAIEGTDYLIADISGNPEDRADSSLFNWVERGYSGYSGYEVYNYVFFGRQTETFNRLLPTNEYVVLQIIGFPSGVPTEKPEDSEPIQWWLFVVAKSDTDQNGILDYQDKLTIGVTDVGGNSPTEVIPDVESVLGHTLKDDNTLFVIYHAADKNYVAKIDLPGRQVLSTNEIDLGADVK